MIDSSPRKTAPAVPSERTLREFAGLLIGLGGVLFGMSWIRRGAPSVPACIALALAVAAGVPGLWAPARIRSIFLLAMAVTRPIGHLVSTALMAMIYYGLITPLGLGLRALGHDPLLLRKPQADSYWVPIAVPADVRRYLLQYQSQKTSGPFPQPRAEHVAT